MHLTRPKSSKGRSRPAMDGSLSNYSSQKPPATPDSPSYSRPDRDLRSQSQPFLGQTARRTQDEVFQMLQQAPAAAPQSLNKYKVLPSIEKRHLKGRYPDMTKLHLSDDYKRGQSSLGMPKGDLKVWHKPPPDPGPEENKDPGSSSSLLLAVRAPCGKRFQHHFDPTDTLQKVKVTAEVKYGVQFGAAASVETMDVPRRTFTDMEMTLAQCGILNKSVLCISNNDGEVEEEAG